MTTPWTRSMLGVICLFLPLTAAAATITAISGFEGNVIETVQKASGAHVVELGVAELFDRPCSVSVNFEPPDGTGMQIETRKCRGVGPSALKKEMVRVSSVTGLQVCTSSSKRVKGYTLFGTNDTGGAQAATFQRPNCNKNWQTRVDCPTGQIARGMELHFAAGTGQASDSLTGIKLLCE